MRTIKWLPLLVALAVVLMWISGCPNRTSPASLPPSNIKSDEVVEFYPTYGFQPEGKGKPWRFTVHGKVYEPEEDSLKRQALLESLRSVLGLTIDEADNPILESRVRPFLVDNERGKSITIEWQGERRRAGISEENGHFTSSLTLASTSTESPGPGSHRLMIRAVLPKGDSRTFQGAVHLISPSGISVISDIDDTVKQSNVTDQAELLRNTFLREFQAVDGMADLYLQLEQSGAVFHYVSGSPWQLYQPLQAFLSDSGFPDGTFHLKFFRVKDSSLLQLFASQQETKRAAILPLLNAFPERRFLLFGDSGEQDPEIYGQLARQFPQQIIGIFIRNVTNENRDSERFATAFLDVPDEHWALFDEASQLADRISELTRR